MSYYCNECAIWLESTDARMDRHNGREVIHRWCSYDKKYRAADQDVYRCGGFVYVRRVIVTKVCDILAIDKASLFSTFDEVKECCLIQNEMDKLIDYNTIGPVISDRMDHDPDKEKMAKYILDNYIIPAEAYAKMGNFADAVSIYQRMIQILAFTYYVDTDNLKTEDNSIKYTKSL